MTILTLTLAMSGAVLPLIVVISIYQRASWRWRLKPHRILLIGLALLFAAFVAQMYLSHASIKNKKFLEHPSPLAPVKTLNVIASIEDSNEILAKLIELVAIPIAVSLIVAALFAKADLSFHEKIKKYEEDLENLHRLKKEIEKEKRDIFLNKGDGKQPSAMIEKQRKLKYMQDRAFDLKLDIEEEFEAFINAKMVQPLSKNRNRYR